MSAKRVTENGLADLRRLAEAATPGPWAEVFGDTVMAGPVKKDGPGVVTGGRGEVARTNDDDFDEEQAEANAKYIAAVDPSTLLGMLDGVEDIRREMKRMNRLMERVAAVVTREQLDRILKDEG